MEIIKELLHLLRINYYLFIPPAIVLGIWMLARRVGWLPKKSLPAGSVSKGNRVTSIAEAMILLCIGLAIFVFIATNTSTGGRLLILDRFQKGFAITNILVAAVIFVGILIAIGFVYFKRTSIGVIIVTVVLSCYGLILNGPEQILESLTPQESTIPGATLTFCLTSPDVQGGELWVNGVYLGTLPYETTFEEFYEKVPFWAEEPNENSRDNKLLIPDHWSLYNGSPLGSYHRPWAGITIPKEPTHWDDRSSRMVRDPNGLLRIRESERVEEARRTYYARVKLGDEWGYSYGGSGSSSGGGGRYDNRESMVHFGFIFIERQKRIEKLLDIARLYDYSPKSDWFEAMETYGSDGWITLRKAMDEEPDMSKVFDAWATWKYNLDKVTDSKSAWQTFKRIYNEVEIRQKYVTSDVTGRAVELIAPRLDPENMIRNFRRTILTVNQYNWCQWQMNGRVQFGINYASNVLYTGAGQMMSTLIGGGRVRLSPGDYAFAHAIWIMDEMLDKKDDTIPNIIESELVPAFIAKNYKNITLIEMASNIGGPSVERYLLRQNWSIDPKELPYSQQKRMGIREVNGWLYLLANLKTQTGEEFRQKNTGIIMNMADIVADRMNMTWLDELDFVFIDRYLGENSFAYKYWPRFKEIVAAKKTWDVLELQFKYLIRMEPLSTADMYLQCWKDYSSGNLYFNFALDDFSKSQIPREKRQLIYSALAEQVNKDISNFTDDRNRTEEEIRRSLLQQLRSELLAGEAYEQAERIYEVLKTSGTQYKPENVKVWLANQEQTHPLINLLVESDEPQLRMLVMGALIEHPIPANREILEKLLNDSDEQVRNAAQEAAKELENLKEIPLSQLAAQ